MEREPDSDVIDFMSAPAGQVAQEGAIERTYMPGEALFGVTGLRMRELGWAVFPQERSGRRLPSVVDGEAIKWSRYHVTAPAIAETRRWSLQAAGANTAIILGPPSHNTFCFDCDITDDKLARKVRELATAILGFTPFQRVGNAPKIALFYRKETVDELPPNRRFQFVAADGVTPADDAIEILSKGKAITSHGHHHKTGQYFKWLRKRPTTLGPEHAPIVTDDQINDFINQVQKVRAFHRNSLVAEANVTWEYSESDGLQVPRMSYRSDFSQWTEDEAGFVVDGREAFLWSLARQAARTNPGACGNDTGVAKLKALVFEEFKRKSRLDGRWTEGFLREEVSEKVSRAAMGVRTGTLTPLTPRTVPRLPEQTAPSAPIVRVKPDGEVDPLGFYGKSYLKKTKSGAAARTVNWAAVDEETDASREAGRTRALQPVRSEIAREVQLQLTTALDSFFAEVYVPPSDAPKRIHVIKAPTGAGKTTRTIRYIAEDPRTKSFDDLPEEERPGPIVFSLPTYNNISELRLRAEVLNLDNNLSDEDLAEQAQERGLVAAEDLEATLADLRRDAMSAGLRTMIYRGKIAAGCQMKDKVQMLMDAGIGTSGLCRARIVKKDEEPEDKFCVYYSTCPAIQQRKEIANSHVVFLPHAFLTLSIPEELQKVRAVIADERIFTLFVHTTTFYRSTLSRARREPKLTKKEREAGLSPMEIMDDRAHAAAIATDALQQGRCPAKTLAEFVERQPKRTVTGLDLVKAAARVCGNAISADAVINPDMTSEQLSEICSKPTGAEVREEYRFWKIIQERIEMLIPDLVIDGLDRDNKFNIPRQAMGNREMRIQHLVEEDNLGHKSELIRISWRSEANWQGAPLLLLDASASPEITSKLFGQREVVVHDIDAPLNVRTIAVVDRTYSNAAIVAKYGNGQDRVNAAKLKDSLQDLLAMTSSYFGYGRVVSGSSVAIRRAMNTGWTSPSNVDFCHFGAMRGLDFAKFHAAAISFGRMEVPTRTIDGIVAALTYDDETPEDPFDREGTGLGIDGKALILPPGTQTVRLRSGQDARISIPMFPGRWASIVQKQYREEELRQFVGRLRPVYREGEAPVWIAVSRVIPDGIVVDDLIDLEDMLKHRGISAKLWEAVRIADGVLHPDLVAAALPLALKDAASAASFMVKAGLNPETGECDRTNRLSWGFTPVRVVDQDGNGSWAFVRTEHRDAGEVARNSFQRILELDVAVVEIGEPAKARQAGVAREADWVSQELGSVEHRQREEADLLENAAAQALARFTPAQFVQPANIALMPRRIFLPVDPESNRQPDTVTVFDLAAMAATERMWQNTHQGHTSKVSSPVLEVATSYEHMGDGDFDADGM